MRRFSFLLALPLLAVEMGAQPAPGWSELEYHASKFGLEAGSTLRREPGRLLLETDAVGRKSREQIVFDPATGAVIERTKDRLGGKAYRKVYRYDASGVTVLRSSPADESEQKLEPGSWTKVDRSQFSRPSSAAGCRLISEPTMLFDLFSRHLWADKPSLDLCVFSGKSWSKIEARRVGEESFRPAETVPAEPPFWRVTIRSTPLDADQDDELELLGLHGDIDVLIDGRGVPLRLKGEVEWIGEIEVFLIRMVPSKP